MSVYKELDTIDHTNDYQEEKKVQTIIIFRVYLNGSDKH